MATPNAKAKAAYEDKARDISALLEWIGCELDAHEEEAERKGINWGHVGDLGHYREKLLDILVSLTGNPNETAERAQLTQALEDLKA